MPSDFEAKEEIAASERPINSLENLERANQVDNVEILADEG